MRNQVCRRGHNTRRQRDESAESRAQLDRCFPPATPGVRGSNTCIDNLMFLRWSHPLARSASDPDIVYDVRFEFDFDLLWGQCDRSTGGPVLQVHCPFVALAFRGLTSFVLAAPCRRSLFETVSAAASRCSRVCSRVAVLPAGFDATARRVSRSSREGVMGLTWAVDG